MMGEGCKVVDTRAVHLPRAVVLLRVFALLRVVSLLSVTLSVPISNETSVDEIKNYGDGSKRRVWKMGGVGIAEEVGCGIYIKMRESS
jgi:hypothetical protein